MTTDVVVEDASFGLETESSDLDGVLSGGVLHTLTRSPGVSFACWMCVS